MDEYNSVKEEFQHLMEVQSIIQFGGQNSKPFLNRKNEWTKNIFLVAASLAWTLNGIF
jgi:hypothetical protein